MSLSRAQNIFMPANINSIVIFSANHSRSNLLLLTIIHESHQVSFQIVMQIINVLCWGANFYDKSKFNMAAIVNKVYWKSN